VTFESADGTNGGDSSIAAHVAFVDTITFTDVVVRAGRGMPGALGATALL
jgi:hypothetical protein